MIRLLCLAAPALGAVALLPGQQTQGETDEVAAPQSDTTTESDKVVPVVFGFVGNLQPAQQPEAAPQALPNPEDFKYVLRESPLGAYIVRYPQGLGSDTVSETEFVEFDIEFPNQGGCRRSILKSRDCRMPEATVIPTASPT